MPPFLGSSPPEFSASPALSRRRIRQAEALQHFDEIGSSFVTFQSMISNNTPDPQRGLPKNDKKEECPPSSTYRTASPEINIDILTVLFSYLVPDHPPNHASGTALARCTMVCTSWRQAGSSEQLWERAFRARWNRATTPIAEQSSIRRLYSHAAGARVLCWGEALAAPSARGPAWVPELDGAGVREVSAGTGFAVALTWGGQVFPLSPYPRQRRCAAPHSDALATVLTPPAVAADAGLRVGRQPPRAVRPAQPDHLRHHPEPSPPGSGRRRRRRRRWRRRR
jgi:hypothetical protein